MTLFNTSKIEKRILEIQSVLNNEKREKEMATGIPMEIFEGRLKNANKPLLAELNELKIKREFSKDQNQLYINILSIFIALFLAFFIPIWQSQRKESADIQSIYQTIIANQDIFIGNEDDFINAKKTGVMAGLPQPYIQYDLDENILKTIQSRLGIIQYQFFLYYLNQTDLLNSEYHQLQNNFVATGSLSLKDLDSNKVYTLAMSHLSDETTNTKFSYIHDTSCLIYMFQKTFSEIKIANREKLMLKCEDDSIERLLNFGYIPIETPSWLLPDIQRVMNNRQAGLGDKLINIQ